MPPRPRHSNISSWGKKGASSAGGRGGWVAMSSPEKTVSVFKFNAIRQLGHSPAGAFSGIGAPHCGHLDVLLMPINNQLAGRNYRVWTLFSSQGSGQITELLFQISAVGEG